jgi:hypothetical protein
LGETSYEVLVETTTKLNTTGPDLAQMEDVHAITDVTGFCLGRHARQVRRYVSTNSIWVVALGWLWTRARINSLSTSFYDSSTATP